MVQKILIIDDDETTAAYLKKGLGEAGFVVDHAATGRDGLFLASDGSYDALILDRMMPVMDGLSVLKGLRAADIATPVLMLSAMGAPEDRVEGLTAGSDDYLAKPFLFAELLARLHSILRRRKGDEQLARKLNFADVEMDVLARKVKRGERTIDLQPQEFRLLEFFLRRPDQVITRTMLLEGVWDYHFDPGTNVIDVHVSRLRKKLELGGEPQIIQTVRGAGYRLGHAH